MTLYVTYKLTLFGYIMFHEKPNNCALSKFKLFGYGNYHDQVKETVHLQTVIQYKMVHYEMTKISLTSYCRDPKSLILYRYILLKIIKGPRF